MAVTRDGTRAYVTNRESDSISVIDTASDAVIDDDSGRRQPLGSCGDAGRQMAVRDDRGWRGRGRRHDAAARSRPPSPWEASGDIAITPDGARAYVAAGLVYVIDTATNAVVQARSRPKRHPSPA